MARLGYFSLHAFYFILYQHANIHLHRSASALLSQDDRLEFIESMTRLLDELRSSVSGFSSAPLHLLLFFLLAAEELC